jgi:menaquinone reductase, iron-sulfur cluster-binding subunit
MASEQSPKSRYGMVIDLDRCTGCGSCAMACAVENNVPPAPEGSDDRKGLTWLRVYRVENGKSFPDAGTAYVPISCQHCQDETPCVTVCPQNAVELDRGTGIVDQVPERCLGCRYCMTACPYHARYFNWTDPVWPAGLEAAQNPSVAPRMRGVVEKCNLCHGRLQEARQKAAVEGRRELKDGEYVPACVEICPTQAIVFGDLADESSAASRASRESNAFRMLAKLGTGTSVFYRSERAWVRNAVEGEPVKAGEGRVHG